MAQAGPPALPARLNLTRPRDPYYDQGDGLQVLYGFTYKYLTLEHFLGQLTRLTIGRPLAERLAQCYSQAWYPGDSPLFIFTDWHVKPHWTKFSPMRVTSLCGSG